ncbi:MAG: IS21 family transposase [bacterium]|nr:IS21 family transposase [bacterium]
MKAGMHRNTASRHLKSGALPSESPPDRSWRTREDVFEADWPEMEQMLVDAPGLEAKALFEHLQAQHPGKYCDGMLRTFQRRVKTWRARSGPEKEIFFPQLRRAGEAGQTDFTWATELAITILGRLFEHMLCVTVLPYSLWQWATPCQSESMAALREGVQNAFFRLGCVPRSHQTDNSTAATHKLSSGKRDFNEEYLALMRHLSLKPRTTEVGAKEQNGSIEATNGALKRSLEQHLLLRGSRDFESREAYVAWLEQVLEKRNASRGERLKEELGAMRPLGVRRLPAYSIVDVRVGSGSSMRVKSNTYTVPPRLIGEKVRVRVFDDRLEVYLGGDLQATRERVRGKGAYHVDWRDVIGWLVRKPGALRRYRYRDAMFPTEVFRRAYERLDESLSTWAADMNYLQVLQLARDVGLHDVERVLGELESAGELARFERVVSLAGGERPTCPEVHVGEVELESYDGLTPEASEEAMR